MRKYLPGGRCGGSTPSVKEDTQGVSSSFSALLAQRDAQIAQLWTPQQQQTQIVVKKVEPPKQTKKEDLVNTILGKDYDTE